MKTENNENEALNKTDVSSSILMNILEENYELNEQFHETARDMIYSFAVAHYNETMTFENWLATYYC